MARQKVGTQEEWQAARHWLRRHDEYKDAPPRGLPPDNEEQDASALA